MLIKIMGQQQEHCKVAYDMNTEAYNKNILSVDFGTWDDECLLLYISEVYMQHYKSVKYI